MWMFRLWRQGTKQRRLYVKASSGPNLELTEGDVTDAVTSAKHAASYTALTYKEAIDLWIRMSKKAERPTSRRDLMLIASLARRTTPGEDNE